MENFTAYNPTKIFFGKDSIDKIHKNIKKHGSKALIIYGKKSAKKYGYFNEIISQLQKTNIKYIELGGIKANPILNKVKEAVDVCKTNKIDFIIALGGGSVIDSAKIIALAYANNQDPWKIMKYEQTPIKTIPIVVVLTFSGTGSEMNNATVIQNSETHEKIGYVNPLIFPTESYLNPNFTLSVPKAQTAYGISDIIAHSLEAFFADGDSPLSDKFVATIINEVMEIAPLLLNNLNNYEYRERIMWAATLALNGTLYHGRKSSGDWGVHSIGHVFSYLFDTPHGASLSITYPAWLKHMTAKIPKRIKTLGFLVSGKHLNCDETIELFVNFFKLINSPISLNEIELCKEDVHILKKYLIHTKASGMNHKLNNNDYIDIINFMK